MIGFVGPAVELGGLYDPSLLPEFEPRLFGLVSAKLAQQEVNAKDGTLVAPWEMKDALRPGTLVAIEAAFIIYHFCGSAPSTVCGLLLCFAFPEGCALMLAQQVFQIQARRVQILEESPLEIEPTAPPVVSASPTKRTPSKLFTSLALLPPPLTDSSSVSSAPAKTTAPAKVSEPTKTSEPSAGPSKRRK